MPAATEYLEETEAPTRAQVDAMKGAVLVEFGTAWCGFCRALAPSVSELLARHPGIQHVKVEDGPGRPLGRSFRVRLWPNLVLLKDGVVVRQLARPTRAELESALSELAGGPKA